MRTEDRKAAISTYKERKATIGVYAVRCMASGQVWVGQSLNLDTVQNRIRFTLRFGGCSNRSLQAAWAEHGPGSFSFETLETLAPDETVYSRDALLKERVAVWRSTLKVDAL